MLIRQFFDKESSTYTYLIVSKKKNAAIIDPVNELVPVYKKILAELNVTLLFTIDTHIHADHVSGSGELHLELGCVTINGSKSADCAMRILEDKEIIQLDEIEIKSLFTPGHTDDSFCFLIQSSEPNVVFTGDTLLIRGNGRTDFQNGNSESLYDSITKTLFTLSDDTILYPGHDYDGNTSSSIFEEKNFSPRISNKSKREFVNIMGALDLPRPKLMDIVIPLNENCGLKKI